MISIQLINHANLSPTQLTHIEHALTQQAQNANRTWKFGEVHWRRVGWKIYVTRNPNTLARRGGVHYTKSGQPTAIVYWKDQRSTVMLSHEYIELLVNPKANLWHYRWPLEVCDPVDAYSYSINGVDVSDYLLPHWFLRGAPRPWDAMRLLHAPHQIAPGGYVGNPYHSNTREWL